MAGFRRTILVTGFGAFPGMPANPTADILRALERHRSRLARLGVALHQHLLPVGYATVPAAMRDVAHTVRPDVIVHLGVAARRRPITVETRALNRARPLRSDAERRTPHQRLELGGAHQLSAPFPAARVVAAMRAAGHMAAVSIDAGDYVCNATLYRSVLWRLAPEVGFIHIPAPRRRGLPVCRAKRPAPTIETLTLAILSTLLIVAKDPLQCPGVAGRLRTFNPNAGSACVTLTKNADDAETEFSKDVCRTGASGLVRYSEQGCNGGAEREH